MLSTGQKEKLFSYAEVIHMRIFGHAMSTEMQKFIGNLSWSFFGGIIAAAIMLGVNITAGRILGPIVYGEYNAILAFGSILATLYLFGIDTSSVRYLSDLKDPIKRNITFTTILIFVLILQVSVTLVLLLFGDYIFSGINSSIIWLGIVMGLVISSKALANSYFRAFQEFFKQNISVIIDAIVVLVCFLVAVFYFRNYTVLSIVYPFVAGASIFILIAGVTFYRHYSHFSFSTLKEVFVEYNRFVVLMTVVSVIALSDKIIIGRYLGLEELGLYSAYYTATFLLVSQIGTIFMNVFWPSAIEHKSNLSNLVKKFTKISIFLSPLWILIITVCASIIIFLFGNEYSGNMTLILLFSVSAFLSSVFAVLVALLGIDHIKRATIEFSLFTFLAIFSLLIFKNVLLYIIAQALLYVIQIYRVRRLLLA